MFKIDYLKIIQNEKANVELYKNLRPGIYPFHSIEQQSLFWGDHINIQAVVGKNGSGKSSLMDLLYMAINNFAYMFERGHHRAAATSLCYVKNLFVDICYTLDGETYVLCCRGDSVYILTQRDKKPKIIFKINKKNAINNEIDDQAIQNIVKRFFYTIVSNYSLQSFISSNYTSNTYVYNREKHKDDKPEKVNSYGLVWNDDRDLKNDSREKIWLNSVFHKNDGYVRSLTLNPYRDNGCIDMEKEKKLAKYRLVALLIDEEKSKSNVFRDYVLDRIVFSLDEDFVRQKFPKYTIEELVKKIKSQIKNKECDVMEIVKYFDLKISHKSPKTQLIAFAYLQQKMNKIVERYDAYECYRMQNDKSIYEIDEKIRKRNIKDFCRQIKQDRSHIVTKIKQTINYLSPTKGDSLLHYVDSSSLKWLDKSFTYRRYVKHFVRSFSSIDKIITYFPPPIFKYEVFLNKTVSFDIDKYQKDEKFLGKKSVIEIKKMSTQTLRKGSFCIVEKDGLLKTTREREELVRKNIIIKWNGHNWEKDEIKLSELSSGELQMMHTLSTHAYHIRNIMSVRSNQIKYRNINMVFDEVEICFHPEYQRQFISRLLAMLNALCRIKQNYYFNVFILTHSPFILSDLPSSNVLYLENGIATKVDTEVFGQNISVLLNQNFFLDFFVGEYAKKRINSLIDFLLTKKRNSLWRKENAKDFIDNIGDKFLQEKLKEKFNEVFGDKKCLE